MVYFTSDPICLGLTFMSYRNSRNVAS